MGTYKSVQERIMNQGRAGAVLSNAEVDGLDHEIDDVLSHIRSAKDYCAAAPSLDELGALQELLALLLFKYDASLSAKQKALIRGFDRSDDLDSRLAVYKAVKGGRFP